jgi:hypothetical protein
MPPKAAFLRKVAFHDVHSRMIEECFRFLYYAIWCIVKIIDGVSGIAGIVFGFPAI